MREMYRHTSLDTNSKQQTEPADPTFRMDHLYLSSSFERDAAELRRDLGPLQQPDLLTMPGWRAVLKRACERIRAIPQEEDLKAISAEAASRRQTLEAGAVAVLHNLKAQATANYNRHIRTLGYEGVRGVPPELPPDSEPASLDPYEPHLVRTLHLDILPQHTDHLAKLKARIEEAQKPDIPGAFSIEAKQQQRNTNEWRKTYNRWMERCGKPEGEKLPEAGLKGGMFLHTDDEGYMYARFMTLRDPYGEEHQFYAGEHGDEIAEMTERWINYYGSSGWTASGSRFRGQALTTRNVSELHEGKLIKGWTCTELRYEAVQPRVVYTDRKGLLIAVNEIPYRATPGELPANFRGVVLGPADPNNSCYGKLFLGGDSVLWTRDGREVQMILDHNGYDEVSDHAQVGEGDIIIHKIRGRIQHGALVLGWVEKGKTPLDPSAKILRWPPDDGWGVTEHKENYLLWVSSKGGSDVELAHEWNDPGIIETYGNGKFYRAGRARGNRLIEEEEIEEEEEEEEGLDETLGRLTIN